MDRRARLCAKTLLFLGVLIASEHLGAQITEYEVTTPTMASGPSLPVPYDGVSEKVNLSNGNLSVSIPLLTLPGRAGNNLTIGISHDSQTYHLQTQAFDQGDNDGQNNYMQYAVAYLPADSFPQMPGNAYWRLQIPTLIAYREQDAILPDCAAQDGGCLPASPIYTDHFAYLDWDGTRYDFSNSEFCYWWNVGPCSSNQPPASVVSPVHVSGVTGTTYGTPGLQSFSGYLKLDTTNTSNIVLTERDGTQVHFNLNVNYVGGSDSSAAPPMTETTGQFLGPMPVAFTEIVDRNGNITTLSVSSSSYVLTDTLGRQVTINSTGVTYPDDTVSTGTRLIAFGPGPAATSNALSLTVSGCTLNTGYAGTSGIGSPTTTVSGSEGPTTAITFPNNEVITFGNDGLGALSFIQYPDGGYKRFVYGIETLAGYGSRYETSGVPPASCTNANARQVTAKFECPSGTCGCMQSYSGSACSGESQTTYTPTLINPIPATEEFGANQQNVVQSYDFNQNLLKKEIHSFAFGCWYVPLETSSQLYSGQGTLLRTTATSYSNTCLSPASITTTYNDMSPALSNMMSYSYPTISGVPWEGGTSSLTFNKPTTTTYTDFTGSVLRTESTPLLWQSNSAYGAEGSYLLDLLSSKSVSGGGATATTTYGYDEYTLQTSGVSSSLHTTGASPPGNQTSVHRLLNGSTVSTTNCPITINNGYEVSYKQYFDTGSLYEFTDPCGSQAGAASHTWRYAYSSTYAGAYPTTITNPAGQASNYAYDFSNGALTSVTDPNSQQTTATYVLGRVTQVNYPDGGQTSYCYTDVGGTNCSQSSPPLQIVSKQEITSSVNKVSTTVFDGFGRPSQTQLNSDIPSTTYTLTQYDALGRKSQVYNPTRCSGITTNCGESTWGYTTYQFDPLDRVTSVTEQDGSTVQTIYDQTCSINTSAVGTLVTDEAGNQRRSCADSLGRLVEVDEPGNNGPTGEPGTGSVTFSGTEQGPVATCPPANGYCYVWDGGGFNVTVNGVTVTASYSGCASPCVSSTSSSIASALEAAVNADSSMPVTATANGATVTLTAKTTGSGTNYSLSASLGGHDTQWFPTPSFSVSSSGSTLTGGSNVGVQPLLLSTPFVTLYNYDALGNLLCVEQHGSATGGTGCSAASSSDASSPYRIRRFSYDSLSRLLTSENPETNGLAGRTSYAYDADNNLVSKTALSPNQPATATSPTSVTTSYTYDTLNRLRGKSYADGYSSNAGLTSPVEYGYDGVSLTGCPTKAPPALTDSYPIGRRTSMCDGSGATSWLHDQMGRVKQERRTLGGASGLYVTYSYNKDGSLATLQTPPQKVISYTMGAAGRALSAVDSGDSINFVTSATYAPPGELQSLTNGNVIYGALAYNSRLQPTQMFYGTNTPPAITAMTTTCPTTPGNVMNKTYSFSLGAGDNGNVQSITNCLNTTRTQNFTYDGLNRMATAQSSGTQWGEAYTIDAWGNLTNRAGINNKTYSEPLSAAPATPFNQLTGYGYDTAGNMNSNAGTAYIYDDENRLVWTSGIMGDQYERYIYDADGNRVEKCAAGSATTACPTSGTTGTLYWRGIGSDTLDESDLAGNPEEEYIFFNGQRIARRDVSSSGATIAVHYYFSDHLGSHAVVENATGTSFEQDIDYYPYGGVEEDYSTTQVPQHYKFTGKERDSESGLDMFGARYYGSSLGRFMTPDWSSMPTAVPYADLSNPQSLNLYSYTKNNPTTLRDPNGHCDIDGEHHNWVWCAAHAVGLTYTRHETAENIRFGFNTPGLGYPTLYKNGRAVDWNKLSDEEVIQTATEYNDALREGRVVTMTPAAAAALTQWGWPGQQSYNEAKNLLNEPNTSQGTVDRRDLLGKVPTEDEAVKMIEDAGGKVERIEGGHAPGGVSPHENPHINYTTASGAKGTIDIQQ